MIFCHSYLILYHVSSKTLCLKVRFLIKQIVWLSMVEILNTLVLLTWFTYRHVIINVSNPMQLLNSLLSIYLSFKINWNFNNLFNLTCTIIILVQYHDTNNLKWTHYTLLLIWKRSIIYSYLLLYSFQFFKLQFSTKFLSLMYFFVF